MPQVKIVDKQLGETFANILNPAKGDPDIVFAKYEDFIKNVKAINSLLVSLVSSPVAKTFVGLLDLADVLERVQKFLEVHGKHTAETIIGSWTKIKKDECVVELMQMCADLAPFKEDVKNAEPEWILNLDNSYKLFNVIELRPAWLDADMVPQFKKYLLTVFRLFYDFAIKLYNISVSPDIDIAEFSAMLISAIGNIQKIPELSRCKDAFAKISNSVGMLDKNFSGYYKDFVTTSNPGVIIESFITDVSNEGSGANATLMFQFRQIINYYKKLMEKNKPAMAQGNSDKLDMLFKLLDEHLA